MQAAQAIAKYAGFIVSWITSVTGIDLSLVGLEGEYLYRPAESQSRFNQDSMS